MKKLLFIILIVLCGCSTQQKTEQALSDDIVVCRYDTVWNFQTERFYADSIVVIHDTTKSVSRIVVYKPVINRTDTTINNNYIYRKESYTANSKSKNKSTIDWKFYTICGVLALLILLTIYRRLK